jgi:hypothetical protein
MLEAILPYADRAHVQRTRSTQAGLLVPGRVRGVAGVASLLAVAVLIYLVKKIHGMPHWPLALTPFVGAYGLASLFARRDVLFSRDGGIAVRISCLGWETVKVHTLDTIAGIDVVTTDARGLRGIRRTQDAVMIRRRGALPLEVLVIGGLDLLASAREGLYLRLATHYAGKQVEIGAGLARFSGKSPASSAPRA